MISKHPLYYQIQDCFDNHEYLEGPYQILEENIIPNIKTMDLVQAWKDMMDEGIIMDKGSHVEVDEDGIERGIIHYKLEKRMPLRKEPRIAESKRKDSEKITESIASKIDDIDENKPVTLSIRISKRILTEYKTLCRAEGKKITEGIRSFIIQDVIRLRKLVKKGILR